MADDTTKTPEDTKSTLSSKLEKIAKEIEGLTVLEMSELAGYLEEKFGVSAMPMMAAAPAAGGICPEFNFNGYLVGRGRRRHDSAGQHSEFERVERRHHGFNSIELDRAGR